MRSSDALDIRGATVEERKERGAEAFRSLESGEPFVMLSDRDPLPVEGYLADLLDVDGSTGVFDTFSVRKRTPDTWVLETEHP